jgi:hypothetical protein
MQLVLAGRSRMDRGSARTGVVELSTSSVAFDRLWRYWCVPSRRIAS